MKKLLMFLGIISAAGLFSCVPEIKDDRFFEDDELTITAYLERNSEQYSMMIELLDRAGFKSAFNAYGNYTLFASGNEALNEYLSRNSKSSIADLSVEEARLLVRYHSFSNRITSSSLGLGKLPYKNLEDDEIVSSFDETGIQGIIINREAKVVVRDIELSNGILHVLDNTLQPIVKSVVQKMEEIGNYSILLQAIIETGFYDELNTISNPVPDEADKRVYFTVFAESDAVLNSKGIFSFQDLKNKYNNQINDPENPADSLYKFVANHIIPEKALFTKDFQTGNYQTYLGELINFVVDRDFRINIQGTGEQLTYTSFVPDHYDFQAKNGVIHTVDKPFDIFFPEPVEVLWEFNDQPIIRDFWRVNGQDSEYFTSLDQFPNMSGTISRMYAHFPYDGGAYGFVNKRALIFDRPDWDVTFKMPIKIVKGRYKLYLDYKDGSGRATIQVIFNGVPIGEPINMVGGKWYSVEVLVGEINLTETTENEVRIVTVNPGQGQMDYVRFEPI